MSSYPLQELRKTFFEDPRWSGVEELIKEFINPLLDMSTVDTSKDGDTVRAEIIGRKIAYETLNNFLNQVKIVGSLKREEQIKSPFR
jgi:hypothetical protein